MPREVITIQVGQCGNQIGCRFWELALQEHVLQHTSSQKHGPLPFDDALSTFFRNVDSRTERDVMPSDGASSAAAKTLRARAVLVDMEDGVVNACLRGPLGDLFDPKQIVTDVSGAGNNWAHGYHEYGPRYRSRILSSLRHAAEKCDSLQCFLLLQSTGGGTGSGVGTYTLKMLEDEFPDYYRFVCCVTPSREDDVITSPYNAMLSLSQMVDHAHCVLPVNNDSLITLVNRINAASAPKTRGGAIGGTSAVGSSLLGGQHQGSQQAQQFLPITTKSSSSAIASVATSTSAQAASSSGTTKKTGEGSPPFGDMNLLVAQMLNHLTASMRYAGSLNLDLNEITTNLVPYPRMHFLNSSLSPLTISKDRKLLPRSFDQMFSDVALSMDNTLCWNTLQVAANRAGSGAALDGTSHAPHMVPVYDQSNSAAGISSAAAASGGSYLINPKNHITLAQAFLVRSRDCGIADVARNVQKTKEKLKFLPFNEDAVKLGLCNAVAAGFPHSCLGLANNCGIVPGLFDKVNKNFYRLYRRKAHVHHYTAYMEQAGFDYANENLRSLTNDYTQVDRHHTPPPEHKSSDAACDGQGGNSSARRDQEPDWPSLLFKPSQHLFEKAALHWLPRPVI